MASFVRLRDTLESELLEMGGEAAECYYAQCRKEGQAWKAFQTVQDPQLVAAAYEEYRKVVDYMVG